MPIASPTTDLTSGQAARYLHVSIRTVCKWMDTGMLKGYRIPGSDHRRFIRAEVAEFCKTNEIPVHQDLLV